MDITDTVSVMRQGEMTATLETNETSPENLAELMVGHWAARTAMHEAPLISRALSSTSRKCLATSHSFCHSLAFAFMPSMSANA